MSSYIVPCIIAAILIHGALSGTDVYSALIDGAKAGLKVCVSIFPAVVIMLAVIAMVRASVAIDLLSLFLAPGLNKIGMPPECMPLALLRPFSGSGALAVATDVIKQAGADSFAGKVAAVMMGSSETSFYTIAVYSAYLKMKNTEYVLPAALSADAAAFIMSAVSVRLFMTG